MRRFAAAIDNFYKKHHKAIHAIIIILLVVFMAQSAYNTYKVATISSGQKQDVGLPTPIGKVTIQKEPRTVKDIAFSTSGDLVIVYTDGTTENRGKDFYKYMNGLASQAVINYCSNGQCVAVAGVKGQKGDTGATGEQGQKGDTGATGATGAAGANGKDGADGQTGATGPQGPAGADGKDGANGTDGQPPVSWAWTYNGLNYQCDRVSNFDVSNPSYTCSQVQGTTQL